MEGTPPEMEANAQEAPDFKEAEVEAFLMREGEGRRRTRCHLCASSPPGSCVLLARNQYDPPYQTLFLHRCLQLHAGKKVTSDNDASEVDTLGHFGTFWDNSEDFLTSLEHLDCFPSHF